MLYHPCAEPSEILKLKKLVKSCLWKYVITPWNKMSRELVSSGCIFFLVSTESICSLIAGQQGWCAGVY